MIFPEFEKKSLGFSLIEILVTISLALIISGIGYVSFSKFSSSQALSTVYANFVNDVSEARSDTLSQVKSSTCTSTQTLVGYRINTAGSGYYRIDILCATDPETPATYTASQLKRVSLPSGTTISMQPGPSMLFYVPNAFLLASFSATVTNSSGSKTLGVTKQGVILQ